MTSNSSRTIYGPNRLRVALVKTTSSEHSPRYLQK